MVPLPEQTPPRTTLPPSPDVQDDQASVTTTSRHMSPPSPDPQQPTPPPPPPPPPPPGPSAPSPSIRPADVPPPSRRSVRIDFSALMSRFRKPRTHHSNDPCTITTPTQQSNALLDPSSPGNPHVTVRVRTGTNEQQQHHSLSATGQTSTKCHLHTDLLANFLLDKRGKFCDVTLVSNDGGRFPTNRGILGARSEYFSTLLFSGFREATEDVVHVDLPATSLMAVLHYVLTGHIHGPSTTITTTGRSGDGRRNINQEEEQEEGGQQRERYVYHRQFDATVNNAKTIISYRKVADYIGCKGMHDVCTTHLSSMLDRNKALACLIFEAIHTDDNENNNNVESTEEQGNRREGDGGCGGQQRGEMQVPRGRYRIPTALFIKVIDAIQTHRTTALVSRTLQFHVISPTTNDMCSNHASSSGAASPPNRRETPRRVTWLSKTGLDRLFLAERAHGAMISDHVWFHVMREWYLYNLGKPLIINNSGATIPCRADAQPRYVTPECMHSLTEKLSEHGLSMEFVMGQMEPSGLVSTRRLMQLYKWFAKQRSLKVSDCEDMLRRMNSRMERREMMVRDLERRVREERGRREQEIERLRETVAGMNKAGVTEMKEEGGEGGRKGNVEEEEVVMVVDAAEGEGGTTKGEEIKEEGCTEGQEQGEL